VDATCTNLRAWALHFAAHGWHVFPITPSSKKPPIIDRWETRASTDPDQINHWWRQVPFTIGIATGPSGLVVVDLDTRKPIETTPGRWAALGIGSGAGVLRALARQRGATVTPTYTVTTASGGWHLYYTTPPGTQLRNTHDVIGWKIDTRAHGGYVVAPGCPLPPGGYQLFDDRDPSPHPHADVGALSVRCGRRCQPHRLHHRGRQGRDRSGTRRAARPAQRGVMPRRLRPGPTHRRRTARRGHSPGRTHHRCQHLDRC
jgi:hypothetical protein